MHCIYTKSCIRSIPYGTSFGAHLERRNREKSCTQLGYLQQEVWHVCIEWPEHRLVFSISNKFLEIRNYYSCGSCTSKSKLDVSFFKWRTVRLFVKVRRTSIFSFYIRASQIWFSIMAPFVKKRQCNFKSLPLMLWNNFCTIVMLVYLVLTILIYHHQSYEPNKHITEFLSFPKKILKCDVITSKPKKPYWRTAWSDLRSEFQYFEV